MPEIIRLYREWLPAPLGDDIHRAIVGVLQSGIYLHGPEVEQLESEFAAYSGQKHCVAFSSGTTALCAAIKRSGIGRVELPACCPPAVACAFDFAKHEWDVHESGSVSETFHVHLFGDDQTGGARQTVIDDCS